MKPIVSPLIQYLRLFGWVILRHLRDHPGRALAVLMGIALGAAVFTSVRLAVHATIASYTTSMDRIMGSSDLTLTRPGGRLPDSLIATLMKHPAVRAASPILSSYVRSATRPDPFLLIGIAPLLDRGIHRWQGPSNQAGPADTILQLMTEPGAMVIGKKLGSLFGWQPGQRVQMLYGQRRAQMKILAVMQGDGLALAEGGRIAVCDIATYQEFTGLFDRVDRIDIKLKKAVSAQAVESIAAMLPAGVVIRPPSARSQSGKRMIRAYQVSLTFLSFISLFVGMFLVYSLVALNAVSRRSELAVMRATGASQRLIFYLFVGEGAFIGLCGWLLALPVSSLLVRHLLAGVSRTVSLLFVRVQVDTLTLSIWEVALSFGVTLAVAVLAALLPARQAMSVPPGESMDMTPGKPMASGTIRRMALFGTGLLIGVYPISRLPSPPSISVSGYLAALLLFVGVALTAPLMLRGMGRLMTPLLRRWGGQPAILAAGTIRQSGMQTAISVGALITAVALFTALVVMIHSFRTTVALWVQQSIAGDLYIRPKLAELNGFRDPLPPSVVAAVQSLPGSVQRVPMRRLQLHLNGYRHLFEAINYADYARRNRFVWMNTAPRQIEADLIAGRGVAVSEVFANQTGLGTGDRYRVQIGKQQIDEPILGVFRDYRTRGGTVYFSLRHYQQRFSDFSWSGIQLNFRHSDAGRENLINRVRATLLACCQDAIEMIDGAGLRRAILRIFDETFAITTVLLIIALVVAAMGIATTLAVQVLQRRRQLNTIRAVGGTAAQLRRMIFWEAGMVVATGQAAGLVSGFILSILLIFVVNRQSFGWTFVYRVDWPSLATALPLIAVTTLLAALPAVRLALRMSPAELLRNGMR